MSTIASPRPSVASSSRRNSTSTDTSTRPTLNTPDAASTRNTRRNRTALRDYYNLKVHPPPGTRDSSRSPSITDQQQTPTDPDSELDRPGFSPEAYVAALLAREGLEGVLRVEAGLVTEIRSLDGERKALVYDNYSKLIAATDTIRRMRARMDPLTPTTSTLAPAIARIAGTAAELAADLRAHAPSARAEGGVNGDGIGEKRRAQQETVRWVLGAPGRFRRLVGEGKGEAALDEWQEVEGCLERWEGVKGVEEVRRACLEALEGVEAG